MRDVLERVAQDRVQNNLEREEMSRESGGEECSKEVLRRKDSEKQERQKFSVMHGEGVIEDMGRLISNKRLPLLCSIEKKIKPLFTLKFSLKVCGPQWP